MNPGNPSVYPSPLTPTLAPLPPTLPLGSTNSPSAQRYFPTFSDGKDQRITAPPVPPRPK